MTMAYQPQGSFPVSDRGPSLQTPQITLLGNAALTSGTHTQLRLERKAAGLLAYLALKGETPRSKLAAMLWPGVEENIARNNLAQTIRRLKQAAGGIPLVEGQMQLHLAKRVEVDIRELADPHCPDRATETVANFGELLAGLEYSDCPDFEDWLRIKRGLFENRRLAALEAKADSAETENDFRTAMEYTQRLLGADPYCESHHRRLMRLFWLAGDRNAALAAYRRCRRTLQNELGVTPSAETLALEHSILRGQAAVATAVSPLTPLPPGLLRPPCLVERDFLLARMETAWRNGQAIFIEGPPGIGKTRLMQEFLGKHGRFYTFQGRPTGLSIPYASIARLFREMLKAFPSIGVPDWVRQELTRLLPELGRFPGTLEHRYDPLHLYPALAEAMRLAMEAGMRRVAFDDLHLHDPASISALHFACLEQREGGGDMQMVFCYRHEALPSAARVLVDTVLTMDRAILIRLDRLSEKGIADMLAGIDPELAATAGELYRHAGGNPFFSLETLRAMHNINRQGEGTALTRSGALPMPRKVRHILEQQLSGLSPQALQLARLAALAGERFQPDMAEALFGLSPSVTATIWAELVAAQILVGWRFSDEFTRRAVLESLPEAVRKWLLKNIADPGLHRVAQGHEVETG